MISIVAVHGMNVGGSSDHCENAWTEKESGTHWLRDLLPEILPRARILAYQYNANVVVNTSVAGVEEQAHSLLYCLYSERRVSIKVIAILSATRADLKHRDRRPSDPSSSLPTAWAEFS